MLGDREFRHVTDQCFIPTRRIADMDVERVHRQLLSPIPVLFCYWGTPEATAEFAHIQNDFIAKCVSDYPERFLAAGTVAMQAPKLAIKELERIAAMGFQAAEIGTNVMGRYLDDPSVVEVLEAASELGLAIFVHPWDAIGEDRLKAYYLPHMVALPADTAAAIARLIFGGVSIGFRSFASDFRTAAAAFSFYLRALTTVSRFDRRPGFPSANHRAPMCIGFSSIRLRTIQN